MNGNMKRWELQQGVAFLRKVGIKPGQTILDFGCRVGHYTIPAAKIVGDNGAVYAIDTKDYALNELKQKTNALNLKNIKIIKTVGQTKLPLGNMTVDVILLYDVLHYFEKDKRAKLYNEVFRTLRRGGLLSIYPKHTLEDAPNQEFKKLTINDVKQEIEGSNFVFERKYCGLISHDDGLNQGCVLNFIKNI
jgi:ubiquinone/menaquinone biosynthesis C-methylase UbiE